MRPHSALHTIAACGHTIVTGLQAGLQQRCAEGKAHVRMLLGEFSAA